MKYTITHKCGHEQTHNLLGKNAERERKIAYFESTDCTECWKSKKYAEEKAMGLVIEIKISGENILDGKGELSLVAVGDTYPYKDALKAAGYKWTEYMDGLGSLVSIKAPKMVWVKHVAKSESALMSALKEARSIGADKIEANIDGLDASAQEIIEEKCV